MGGGARNQKQLVRIKPKTWLGSPLFPYFPKAIPIFHGLDENQPTWKFPSSSRAVQKENHPTGHTLPSNSHDIFNISHTSNVTSQHVSIQTGFQFLYDSLNPTCPPTGKINFGFQIPGMAMGFRKGHVFIYEMRFAISMVPPWISPVPQKRDGRIKSHPPPLFLQATSHRFNHALKCLKSLFSKVSQVPTPKTTFPPTKKRTRPITSKQNHMRKRLGTPSFIQLVFGNPGTSV